MMQPIYLKNKNNVPTNTFEEHEQLSKSRASTTKNIYEIMHILDHMQVVFFSFEASMRKIKDNSIKFSVLQVRVQLHFFRVDAMQQRGTQSFQLC